MHRVVKEYGNEKKDFNSIIGNRFVSGGCVYAVTDINDSGKKDYGTITANPKHVLEGSLNTGTASEILTPLDGETSEVRLTNGNLYFNVFTPAESDIGYFNPETAHTEKWDTEQVTKYLGIASFAPSYVPEELMLLPYAADSFISDYKDDTMYWTVVYVKKSLVFDNFGYYYSDSVQDEYYPLQKKLLIEVSKNKIPESDVIYEAEKVKVSKIKNTEK